MELTRNSNPLNQAGSYGWLITRVKVHDFFQSKRHKTNICGFFFVLSEPCETINVATTIRH